MEFFRSKSKLFFVLISLIFIALSYKLLEYEKDLRINTHLQEKTQSYTQSYHTIYDSYKKLSESIFFTLIDNEEVKGILNDAKDASTKEKDLIREELYRHLKQKYFVLKELNIKQLHFHLPNNESFLRFHRPKKYGDNLSDVRATVAYVNRYKEAIHGFEEGRIYNGYRFVYPLLQRGEYLGSVEVSFSTLAMNLDMMKYTDTIGKFMVSKELIKEKVFSDEKSNYTESIFDDFYVEKKVDLLVHKHFDKDEFSLISKKSKEIVKERASSSDSFSIFDEKSKQIITIIKIKNPISNKVAGILVLKSSSNYIINKQKNSLLMFGVVSMFIVLLSVLGYILTHKKSAQELSVDEPKLFKIKLVFTLLTIVVASIIYITLTSYKSRLIDLELSNSISKLKSNYEIIRNDFTDNADSMFYTISQNKRIMELLLSFDSAGADEKAKLRDELYSLLQLQFEGYKRSGLKILLFSNPHNEVLLRVHKREKFGDSIEGIRYSIEKANKDESIVRGFEAGKISHAFRNVYPLGENGRDLGAVDIAFSSEYLQRTFEHAYKIHTHFLVNKNVLDQRIWKLNNNNPNYEKSLENENYFISKIEDLNHAFVVPSLQKFSEKFEFIKAKMSVGDDFSVYFLESKRAIIASFLAIESVKGEEGVAAYLVSYSDNNRIQEIYNSFYYYNIMALIFLMILVLLMYNSVHQKEVLRIAKIKADEATKSKSEFLANMSHEVRTPLNAILGFVQVLKAQEKDPKLLRFINIIHESSHSLLQIIEDILDFSKIESGKLLIDKIDFDPKKEFESVVSLFDAQCSQKDVSLVVNLDENLPASLHQDPFRIKQIMANLLSNAVKFTDIKKHIYVNVLFKDGELKVSVRDEGIGISPEKLGHIFEAFSQEDSSTTRKYGGTGLGLSISSRLVRMLGGELHVHSEQGMGSEFYFSIPAEAGKEIQETQEVYSEEFIFEQQRVLLVEDNKANQMFMSVLLDSINLDCDIASDGEEAVEKFKAGTYDIVLMDENMPKMNGTEATKLILEYEKQNKLKHTPIIALTANALQGDKEKFLDAGMDEYLKKPLEKNTLCETLERFL